MSHLKTKIKTVPDSAIRRSKAEVETKSLKPYYEYEGPEVEVLGVPFGGPVAGRDSEGEAFHEKTDIGLNIGDSVLATYYHGFGPDDPFTFQDPPHIIGRAVYVRRDERGHWFKAKLDDADELALRVINALDSSDDVKASSGAVGHLVRMGKAGLIDVWPVGEMAIFDTNEARQPANDYAVVTLKRSTEQPETEAKAETVEAPVSAKSDDIEVETDKEAEESTAVKNRTKETETEVKNIMSDELETLDTQETEVAAETQGQVETVEAPEIVIDYGAMAKAMTPVISQAVEDQVVEAVNGLNVDEKISEALKAFNAPPVRVGGITAPNVKRVTKTGFSDEPMEAYKRYIRTGDKSAAKAALQEGTDSEGGFLVPDDHTMTIVEKRDDQSFARQAGADVITTSSKLVDVPVEATTTTNLVSTAEEAAADQNEPTFANKQATLVKYTKLIKMSDELLADEKANLMPFLSSQVSRKMGTTENSLVVTEILANGTAAFTAAGAAALTAGEVIDLESDLGEYADDNSTWVTAKETFAAIRKLQGNPFLFQGNPQGSRRSLMEYPVAISSAMPAMTTGNKSIAFGNFNYLTIVENGGLVVKFLDQLYAENGQVALLYSWRVDVVATIADAFQYITQA